MAEACLVDSTAFTIENLVDLLLHADSKNCALLKEAAMDFMLENDEVLEKISFKDAPGGVVGRSQAQSRDCQLDTVMGAVQRRQRQFRILHIDRGV